MLEFFNLASYCPVNFFNLSYSFVLNAINQISFYLFINLKMVVKTVNNS